MANTYFAIVIDNASTEQLNAAQAIIKANANGWWHRLTTCWIAGGRSASEWRTLLTPAIEGGATVLILKLPTDEAGRSWALRGPNATEQAAWLKRNYRKPN